MPIYEYVCKKCEAKFDHLARSMSASDAKVKCPKCESNDTARALSVFAVRAEGMQSDPAPSCGRCGGAPGSCQM